MCKDPGTKGEIFFFNVGYFKHKQAELSRGQAMDINMYLSFMEDYSIQNLTVTQTDQLHLWFFLPFH